MNLQFFSKHGSRESVLDSFEFKGFRVYRRATPGQLILAVVVGVLAASPAAFATNGYFQIGYGAKSVAMAGAGVANPQDSLAAASNPAAIALVDDGWDLGARAFMPIRDGAIDCSGTATLCTRSVGDKSDRELFLVPNVGYIRKLNDKMSAALTLFANGGMNTHYKTNIYDEAFAALGGAPPGVGTGLPATGTLGVNLEQMLLSATLSYQIHENHTLGVSPVFGFQRFSARGLGDFNFVGLSADPGSLTDRQTDSSIGAGIRFGWIGQVHPNVTLGANLASKVYMTKLEKYSGLFADSGAFDIPAHVAFGMSIRPNPKLTLAFEAQRIFYSDIDSINNPGPTPAEFGGVVTPDRMLGASNGIGFGWESIWAFKVGAMYELNNKWTLRAGYNHGDSPIPNDEVLINILAPGTVEDHLTAGISYRYDQKSEVTLSYMYAVHNQQSDPVTSFAGSSAKFGMHQHALDISYSRRF
jgi:long-chain fatty acid transport protein